MNFTRNPHLENKPQACMYITHTHTHTNIRVFRPIYVFDALGYLTPAVLESLTKHLCRSN